MNAFTMKTACCKVEVKIAVFKKAQFCIGATLITLYEWKHIEQTHGVKIMVKYQAGIEKCIWVSFLYEGHPIYEQKLFCLIAFDTSG